MKICPRCKIKKLKTDFPGIKKRSGWCRPCCAEQARSYYYENKEKSKKHLKEENDCLKSENQQLIDGIYATRLLQELKAERHELKEALKEFVDDGMCWDTNEEAECGDCGWCKGNAILIKTETLELEKKYFESQKIP